MKISEYQYNAKDVVDVLEGLFILSHYDVNFLYVLSLYARNNAGAKEAYKRSISSLFDLYLLSILWIVL